MLRYWVGFRVKDGQRAIIATPYVTHEEAMKAYETKKSYLQPGEQLSPPLVAESEEEVIEKIKITYFE